MRSAPSSGPLRAVSVSMGSGRDKRKKQAKRAGKESEAASGACKTDRKTDKNAAKLERRAAKATAADDIDAILASIKLVDAKRTTVEIEEDCAKPTPRCNCSWTSTLAQKPAEIVLFGGEVVDGDGKTRVFGDLFRYDATRNKWSLVKSPNAPPPRSAHQAVAHGGYVYVFGGEFTSPSQERFHHYRDLWRLELETNSWEQLPKTAGPSARSGHRMVAHPKRDSLLLFGGFYDTGNEVRYYDDVWELLLGTMTWKRRAGGGSGGSVGPSPRSAAHVSAYGDSMFVYGGYCKYAGGDGGGGDGNRNGDGNGDGDGDVEKGVTHGDLWRLDLKSWTWEKLKKKGLAPGPRAGATSATHVSKRRLVFFGGVVDHEVRKGEVIVSEFFSDSYSMRLEDNRWFPVTLYADGKDKVGVAPGTESGGKEEAERVARGESANADFNVKDATVRAAIRIQAHYRGYAVRKAFKLYKVGGQVSELLYSPGSGEAAPRTAPRPRGRMNAAVAVRGNVLYLYGGAVEIGDAEVALDDLWALELTARPKWRLVAELSAEAAKVAGGDHAESSDDEEEEERERMGEVPAKKGNTGNDDDDDDE